MQHRIWRPVHRSVLAATTARAALLFDRGALDIAPHPDGLVLCAAPRRSTTSELGHVIVRDLAAGVVDVVGRLVCGVIATTGADKRECEPPEPSERETTDEMTSPWQNGGHAPSPTTISPEHGRHCVVSTGRFQPESSAAAIKSSSSAIAISQAPVCSSSSWASRW